MKLFADYHTHTRYSHGKGTVEENILAARAKGLREVAITDHGPASLPGVRASLDRLSLVSEECQYFNRLYPEITALAGAEANLVSADGKIDVPPSVIEDLDLLLVGLHPMVIPHSPRDAWRLFGQGLAGRFSRHWREKARVENTKAMIEAVHRHPVDIVTHPGLQVDIDTRELARACAARDTAMEINSSHGYMTAQYCRLAALEGASFVINSDAHRPEEVGNLDQGIAVAVKAGLEPDQIINAETPDSPSTSPQRGNAPLPENVLARRRL